MSGEAKEIEKDNLVKQPLEPLRAVVFGSQQQQVRQMTDQLIRKKILARGIVDERQLMSILSEVDPDLVFLEINGITQSPIEQIVKVVFLWITNYARKVNAALNSPSARLWAKAKLILYKSDEAEAIMPMDTAGRDLDDILFKCKDQGDVIYIGLYSTWSFYSKIEPLLVKE